MANRKDLLSEAIADAKAVKETALANAKLALEEAFTPKLQSMISAKLAEEADDEMEEDEASDSSTSSDEEEVDDDEDIKNTTDIKNEEAENPTAFLPGQQKLDEGEELVMDEQAYIVYHQASLGTPCLSFDIIPDDLGNDRADAFPLTLYGVAGTQAPKSSANSIVVFKMENLHPIKRKATQNTDEDEDDS